MSSITVYDMDYDLDGGPSGEFTFTTIEDVRASVETNLWLANTYAAQGAAERALECATEAYREYLCFCTLLDAHYAGLNFGEQVRACAKDHGLIPGE